MNIQKLKEVVTSQANKEAQDRIENTKKDIEEQLNHLMTFLSKDRERKLKDIESSYQATVSQVQFQTDSFFKKQILHTRHDVFQKLKAKLLKEYLSSIQKNPSPFLTKIVPLLPPTDDIYCSKEFEKMMDQKKLSDFGLQDTNYPFKGVDPTLNPGFACVNGKVKYMFLLEEDVNAYIDTHQEEIGNILFHD